MDTRNGDYTVRSGPGSRTTEDLHAFEQRLSEVIASLKPATYRSRLMLILVSLCTVVGAILWASDSDTTGSGLIWSFFNHPLFSVSCLLLIVMLCCGIHRKVVAPSIIASRCRLVLEDFNLSCDDNGKLILKPRPTVTVMRR